jgi:hypothetical protein
VSLRRVADVVPRERRIVLRDERAAGRREHETSQTARRAGAAGDPNESQAPACRSTQASR